MIRQKDREALLQKIANSPLFLHAACPGQSWVLTFASKRALVAVHGDVEREPRAAPPALPARALPDFTYFTS
jgi:hypothetical protein